MEKGWFSIIRVKWYWYVVGKYFWRENENVVLMMRDWPSFCLDYEKDFELTEITMKCKSILSTLQMKAQV